MTWSLNGGDDESLFSIDASTGVLTFLTAPDAENPSDTDSLNDYVVNIKAIDSAENESNQLVTVVIDETSPLITGPTGSEAGDSTVSTSIEENKNTVLTFTADETVTWSKNGGTDVSKFNLDSSTGELSFKTAPDFENKLDADTNNDYEIIVRATDQAGNVSDQSITVNVTDIDDVTPSILGPSGSKGDKTSSLNLEENKIDAVSYTHLTLPTT